MRKSIKKIIALSISAISLIATTSISANAEWMQNSTGWWYTEGSSWSVGWRQINNQWYYFDTTGYMKTGWLQDTDGKWYYLSPTTGEMAKNIVTPDGYKIGENGVWVNTNNQVTTPTPQVNTNVSNTQQPTVTTNNSTTSTSSSSHSSSSSSSSSNSKNTNVTIFYPLSDITQIDSMCMGIQGLSDEKPSTNPNILTFTKYNYGILIVDAKDYGMTSRDMVHNKNSFELINDNGVMKLVKKSTTNTGSSSSNSSSTTPSTPTTTSSAVVITPVVTPTTTGSSVTIS